MAGYKTFVAGEEALAADVNGFLMSQTVPRFTNAAARTAALTGPATNQLSMLDDRVGVIQRWSGSAWVDMPATLIRWIALNPNVVVAATPLDVTLTTFTMPFSGMVLVTGLVGCTAGAGATTLEIGMTADPTPASVPAPNAAAVGASAVQPANTFYGTFPFSAQWANLAVGTSVTPKLRIYSTSSSMGALLNAVQAQITIIPTMF